MVPLRRHGQLQVPTRVTAIWAPLVRLTSISKASLSGVGPHWFGPSSMLFVPTWFGLRHQLRGFSSFNQVSRRRVDYRPPSTSLGPTSECDRSTKSTAIACSPSTVGRVPFETATERTMHRKRCALPRFRRSAEQARPDEARRGCPRGTRLKARRRVNDRCNSNDFTLLGGANATSRGGILLSHRWTNGG